MNSYLSGSSDDINGYLAGATAAINKLSNFVSKNELGKIKQEKLQCSTDTFNEFQYLQSAAELTVCSYFAEHYPYTFKYENKINPPKDVDCTFEDKGIQFNVEVKCADFTQHQKIAKQDGIHLDAIGRNSDFYELEEQLKKVLANKDYPLLLSHHMDNKLKDFLKLAHEKFIQPSKLDHLNVLIVCCDTPLDMQKWVGYLFGNQGLFTEYSFSNPKCYDLVDYVVLSNVYHRHYNYRIKNIITNHWEWIHAFNLAFLNPFRQLEKIKAIQSFTEIIPNFSREFFSYEGPKDSEGNVHSALKVPYLVEEIEYRNNIFYFQPN